MQVNPANSFDLIDAQGLSSRRETEAAQDFESVFIQMSLKQMRPSTQGGLLSAGMAEDVFYQFLDEAIAKEMAKSDNNFGIAEAVERQVFE
jgi:Rod binding domain-containing protein